MRAVVDGGLTATCASIWGLFAQIIFLHNWTLHFIEAIENKPQNVGFKYQKDAQASVRSAPTNIRRCLRHVQIDIGKQSKLSEIVQTIRLACCLLNRHSLKLYADMVMNGTHLVSDRTHTILLNIEPTGSDSKSQTHRFVQKNKLFATSCRPYFTNRSNAIEHPQHWMLRISNDYRTREQFQNDTSHTLSSEMTQVSIKLAMYKLRQGSKNCNVATVIRKEIADVHKLHRVLLSCRVWKWTVISSIHAALVQDA